MKGLLLKDFYLLKKYCKAYLFMIILFVAVALAVDNVNPFALLYPCMFSGVIPMTLLSYDERSKWSSYCCTLPYSRKQMVSAKYLIGLFIQLAVILLIAITQVVRMIINGDFLPGYFQTLMSVVLIASLIIPTISLPLLFKLGVERGRIAYYIAVGFACGGSVAIGGFWQDNLLHAGVSWIGAPVGCLIMIAIYALSWYLSIKIYTKRDIA